MLTGTVETYTDKLAAKRSAFLVDGVRTVANAPIVHPGGIGDHRDSGIATRLPTPSRETRRRQRMTSVCVSLIGG